MRIQDRTFAWEVGPLCPKMGKCVRLRDRERGRDVALVREKIFFGGPLKATRNGERWSPGQGIDGTKGPLDRRQSKHH